MAKTRTIAYICRVVSGEFQCVSRVSTGFGAFPEMDLAIPTVSFSSMGFFVNQTITWTGNPGAGIDFFVDLLAVLPSGFSSTGGPLHDDTGTVHVDAGDTASIDFADPGDPGEITITIETEEVEGYVTEDDFPDTFGPKVPHCLHRTTKTFRERLVIGSHVVIVASIGGSSLNISCLVTALNQFYLGIDDGVGDLEFLYGSGQGCSATALPLACGVALECEVDFGGGLIVPLGCPLSGSAAGHSVGGGSASANAPAGSRPGSNLTIGNRTVCSTIIQPPKEWELFTYFRAMENAYGANVNLRVDQDSANLNVLTSCPDDGTLAASGAQEWYHGDGEFSQKGSGIAWPGDMAGTYSMYGSLSFSPIASQPADVDANEWFDFQCGIDSAWLAANGEEDTDWRCLIQSKEPIVCGSISQEPDFEVEDGSNTWTNVANVAPSNAGGYVVLAVSGGVGSAQRVFAFPTHEQNPKMDWQSGMEMEVILQADSAGEPFTVDVNGKTWSDIVGPANSDITVTFDLRAPHNATADTDSLQSRWPIGSEGEYFGVNAAAAIKFSGLTDGVTYRINSVTLKRRSRSKLNLGLPTQPWLNNGISDPGSDYLRHVFGESYKVALEIAGMTRTLLPTGDYLYLWPDVQQFFDSVAIRPGWTGVNTASAEGLAMYLMWLGGVHGAYDAGAGWVNSFDRDTTGSVALVAMEGSDVIAWYPCMGEPGGAYAEATPMRVGKVLRGRVGIVVIDSATHAGAAGVEVGVSGGASASETVTTDSVGFGRSTPRKFGAGTATLSTNNVSFEIWNRWVAWAGFSSVSELLTCLSIDISRAQRFVRAYCKEGTIWLAFAQDAAWGNFIEIDTGLEPEIMEVRWEKNSADARLFLLTMTDDEIFLMVTKNEGGAITGVVSLTADATQATMAIGENQIIYAYWRDAAGSLRGKMLNFEGTIVEPQDVSEQPTGFEVLPSGVDDADIACAVTPGHQGQFLIAIDYYGSGALRQIVSVDGRNFS